MSAQYPWNDGEALQGLPGAAMCPDIGSRTKMDARDSVSCKVSHLDPNTAGSAVERKKESDFGCKNLNLAANLLYECAEIQQSLIPRQERGPVNSESSG